MMAWISSPTLSVWTSFPKGIPNNWQRSVVAITAKPFRSPWEKVFGDRASSTRGFVAEAGVAGGLWSTGGGAGNLIARGEGVPMSGKGGIPVLVLDGGLAACAPARGLPLDAVTRVTGERISSAGAAGSPTVGPRACRAGALRAAVLVGCRGCLFRAGCLVAQVGLPAGRVFRCGSLGPGAVCGMAGAGTGGRLVACLGMFFRREPCWGFLGPGTVCGTAGAGTVGSLVACCWGFLGPGAVCGAAGAGSGGKFLGSKGGGLGPVPLLPFVAQLKVPGGAGSRLASCFLFAHSCCWFLPCSTLSCLALQLRFQAWWAFPQFGHLAVGAWGVFCFPMHFVDAWAPLQMPQTCCLWQEYCRCPNRWHL